MRCFFYRLLYKAVPVKKLQAFFIERHFSDCAKCRELFFDDESFKSIGITPEKIKVPAELWRNINKRIEEIEQPKHLERIADQTERIKDSFFRSLRWKWAAATVVILLLLLLVIHPWKSKMNINDKPIMVCNQEIIIQSVKVENQPAKVVYFQPGSKNRLIVWIKK
jgi:hypothetical protein